MDNVPKFQVFEPKFDNEELENEFNSFFYKNNLTALFTDEHMATPITVTYVDARSVVNEGGSYHRVLIDFSELITLANDNKSYEEAMFKIIYESRTFQSMIKKIKDLIQFSKSVDDSYKHNLWNVVWYRKDLI